MIYKRLLIVLLAPILFSAHAKDGIPTTIDGVLNLFDKVIESKELYLNNRYVYIDSIKACVQKLERLEDYESLGNEFRGVDIDSAIRYYSQGFQVAQMRGDSVYMQRFRLLKASIMPVVGVVKESVEEYESIADEYLYTENKELFFESGNRLNFYVSSFYPYSELKNSYLQKGVACNDSLLMIIPLNTPHYKLYKAQVEYVNGSLSEALSLLDELLTEVDIDDNMFARAASMHASIMAEHGNEDENLYYLTLSAISDILSGTREGTSLQMLGVALFERGDIDRAYLALTTALDNAVSSGARIRALESSQAVPVISQTFRAKDQRKVWWLFILVVCLVIALVGIGFVIVYLHKEKRKLEILGLRLVKSNYAKETYMSQFLNLCSVYMDRFEDFNRFVGRKITTGQIGELHSIIKSGKVLAEQNGMFFEMFDDAFIHIYPSFVADVNSLLLQDKQILLSEKSSLNMELRILAFMRMGIVDNARIARFLGLSLNTIYTYRNKMKSRANNRETFEEDVLKIGRIL